MFKPGIHRLEDIAIPFALHSPDEPIGGSEPPTLETDKGEGQGGTSATTKNTEKQPDPIPYVRFKAVNDQLKDALKKVEDNEKAQSDAETKRLAEEGNWKTLHERAEARIKELEPLQAQYDELATVVSDMLADAKKGLPKHIAELLDDRPLKWQHEYLKSHKNELEQKKGPPDINARNRGGDSTPDPKERERELRTRYGI